MSLVMQTLVLGTPPRELTDWLERRRRLGQDRHDEMWEGRYVVAPDPDAWHGMVQSDAQDLLRDAARRLGLRAVTSLNIGEPTNFRIPDGALVPRDTRGVWHDTAVLVVEVVSPDDASLDKLDFYTAHGVAELLVLDPRRRTVRCFALQPGQTEPGRSDVLELTCEQLRARIDWP